MKSINPRKYEHQISILRKPDLDDVELDSGGNPLDLPDTVAIYWANIKTKRGMEIMAGNQVHEILDYVITIPSDEFSQCITAADRIQFDNRDFEIVFADDKDFQRREVEIGCKEIDP